MEASLEDLIDRFVGKRVRMSNIRTPESAQDYLPEDAMGTCTSINTCGASGMNFMLDGGKRAFSFVPDALTDNSVEGNVSRTRYRRRIEIIP